MALHHICFIVVLVVLGIVHGEVHYQPAKNPVDEGNRYIIGVENNIDVVSVATKLEGLTSGNDTLEYEEIWRIQVGLKYLFVQMNEAALNVVREYDEITFIEQDSWVSIQSKEEPGNEEKTTKNKTKKEKKDKVKKETSDKPTDQWGLDRIDQRNLPLDGEFTVKPNAGTGAHIYVVGTGVDTKHEEFEGRASNIYDYRGEDYDGRDCSGHGTHIASLAAGKTYGVAKNATIYGVRITRCRGSGKLSDAVKAMEWLSHNVKWPSVALIGVSAQGPSPALDNAIHRVYLSRCMVVLPAGNNNSLACDVSPARMQLPITVGASTTNDYALYYSNHGSCVDLFAPGLRIEGAFYDAIGNTVETTSGTSMASAYVAGAVAMHMGNGMPPFKIKAYLLRHATEDQLAQVDDDTPNKLLYVGKVRTNDDYRRIIAKKTKEEVDEGKEAEDDKEKGEKDGDTPIEDDVQIEVEDEEEEEKAVEEKVDSSSKDNVKTEL